MNVVFNVINLLVGAVGGPSMLKFLFRRTMAAVPVLFAIMLVTFGLSQALPGGPFDTVNQRPMPEHVRAQLEQRYGLNKALFVDLPMDGLGSDMQSGEQQYLKGGFAESQRGTYPEPANSGFSVYRTYDLVRWDEANQTYVTYTPYPYRDWKSAESVRQIQLGSLMAGSLISSSTSRFMTLNASAIGPVADTGSQKSISHLEAYKMDCGSFRNLPGWSLLAKRQECVTIGGNQSNLINEAHVTTRIDPLDTQFWGYLWNAVRLDFGPSLNIAQLQENTKVIDEIRERLPVSMKLGVFSIFFGFLFGIPLGVLAAIYHNSPIDYGATLAAILGASIPNFVLAPILIIIFTVKLGLVPSPDPTVWREASMFSLEYVGAALLPVISLALGMSAGIARLTRASLLQVLNEEYIRTARAKGLRERSVIYIHALKNSLIPVATILGPLLAGVLTGTFIVERVFAIPGLGDSFIDGVGARDYTTIMAITLLFSVFLIAGNIFVDLLYTWLDPRIRFD